MASRSQATASFAAPQRALPAFNLLQRLAQVGEGELLNRVADASLALHLPSTLRLCQACKALRGQLAAVRAEAETRRLRWVGTLDRRPVRRDTYATPSISANGLALTGRARAIGPLLPMAGRFSFSVRIEKSEKNDGAFMLLGVCTSASYSSWGFSPTDGKLKCTLENRSANRYYRTDDPFEDYLDEDCTQFAMYPSGNGSQLMVDEEGQPANVADRANGTVVEIVLDRSDGSLAFGINGSPARCVPPNRDGTPFKIPPGAQLRAWGMVISTGEITRYVKDDEEFEDAPPGDDCVCFVRPYLHLL